MMKRPPRGLTDKDMIRNYVEEKSVEAQMLTAAKKAEKRRLVEEAAVPEPLYKAGFTPELSEKLGNELLALKIELAASGVKNYGFKIKRDGEKITLTVIDKKF